MAQKEYHLNFVNLEAEKILCNTEEYSVTLLILSMVDCILFFYEVNLMTKLIVI